MTTMMATMTKTAPTVTPTATGTTTDISLGDERWLISSECKSANTTHMVVVKVKYYANL